MQFTSAPLRCHKHHGLAPVIFSALCFVLSFGTNAVQANELTYNQVSIDFGASGDLNSVGDDSDNVRSLSVSLEFGENKFFELTGASGEADVVSGSFGWFNKGSSSTSGTYATFGTAIKTGGLGDSGLAASLGVRIMLTPHIELSPSVSLFAHRIRDYYHDDKKNELKAGLALALRLYPTNAISIDISGIASQDVSGTLLGISGHF